MSMQYAAASSSSPDGETWFSSSNFMTRIMGFSFLASLFQGFASSGAGMSGGAAGEGGPNSYIADSVRLFLLGTIIEGGRRFFGWVIERFKLFQFSITAQFTEGDPAYEWIILLLTEEKIWTRSRQFRVNATSSLRQWTVNFAGDQIASNLNKDKPANEHAEYVPTYEDAQLFKWKGYWAEVRRGGNGNGMGGSHVYFSNGGPGQVMGRMFLTLYTRDMGALAALVEEARQRYVKTSRPHVIVHSADQPAFGPGSTWSTAKRKSRRPLSSIILQDGVINSLVEDAREFIRTEDWYTKAGIPHRRGYLLYGPPGTGKSSTIYAVAGELGLEIYSLSLASGFVDDSFLARAVSSIPKQAIFLIEDIDCAFPSREELDDDEAAAMERMGSMMPPGMVTPGGPGRRRSSVTLSGLLNVLDGVGSEEGKLFFATTNYIDRLDAALLRPGRIDKKIQYKLATKAQAAALFLRFYPGEYTTLESEKAVDLSLSKEGGTSPTVNKLTFAEKETALVVLSEQFAASVPEHEFSTAELQGFLLSCKQQPEVAVQTIAAWVEQERREKAEKTKREDQRKEKQRAKKEEGEARRLQGGLARLGVSLGAPSPGAGGMVMPPPGTFGGPVGPSFGGVPSKPSFNAPVGAFVGGPTLPLVSAPVAGPANTEVVESLPTSTVDVDAIAISSIPVSKPLVNGVNGA